MEKRITARWRHLKPVLTIGWSTRQYLALDLDDTNPQKAFMLGKWMQENYGLGSFCTRISSVKPDGSCGMHLIFDDRLSWSRIKKILGELEAFNILQKGSLVLRLGWENITLRLSDNKPHWTEYDTMMFSTIHIFYKNKDSMLYSGGIDEYCQMARIVSTCGITEVMKCTI